jgi:hypothetical protein
MDKIKGWIISMVGLVIVYGAINLVLYGAQELWHKGDTDKLNAVKEFIKEKKIEIDSLEQRLATTESDLDEKKSQLDSYKAFGNTYQYNLGVDDYNNLLSQYKLDLDRYNSAISVYNQKINEGNELSKKVGSRWYVIPVPRIGKSKR